jgi:hypothetical protein
MVMMVVVVVMLCGGKRRAGEHQQKQGSGKNFLHGTNVARGRQKLVEVRTIRTRTGTGAAHGIAG